MGPRRAGERSETIVGLTLLASGFGRRDGREIGRQFVWLERLYLHRKEAEGRETELDRTVGAIHCHGHANDVAAVSADNIYGLLHAAPFGHDVFDHENFLAGSNFESASQGQFAFFFLDKDEAKAELAGYFLAEHQPAHGRRNDGGGAQVPDFPREFAAEFFDGRHLLQREGALEILAAVQAAAENEMAFQKRAAVAEDLENLGFSHGLRLR